MENKKNIQELIERSGHDFHCKVGDYFKKRAWNVLMSPYYSDNVTSKSREIDIVVEKSFPVGESPKLLKQMDGLLQIRLFIECKKIDKPVIFWFREKDLIRVVAKIKDVTPLNKPEQNTYKDPRKHHYCREGEVAKIFYSGRDESDNEPIFKALNQVLNSTIYFRRRHDIFELENTPGSLKILNRQHYPIIVCDTFSNFFRRIGETCSNLDENFQLEINYSYLDYTKQPLYEYFIIDVVEFDKLDNFLEVIAQDVDALTKALAVS